MGMNGLQDLSDLSNRPLDLFGNGLLSVVTGGAYDKDSKGNWRFSDDASMKINDTLESIERLLKGK
jgi:hypothetical protein